MRVPNALAAAGIATSAVLLLASCGGSESKSPGKIAGVQTSAPSATASPTATASAGRPTITFPSSAKNVFEGQQTGDPKKDAVLADNAQWVDAMDDAIFQGTASTKTLEFYTNGQAIEASIRYVQGYVKKGDKWAGTTRFFNRKVTFGDAGSAYVVYCADESKSYITNPKKPTKHTPTSASSYVLYNTQLTKNKQGVWQTTNVLSDRGAKQCQP